MECPLGFEWFEKFCLTFGTIIVIINHVGYSPDKELVEYFISIIPVFSSRVYGLRKYGKALKDDGLQD